MYLEIYIHKYMYIYIYTYSGTPICSTLRSERKVERTLGCVYIYVCVLRV